MKMSKVIKQEKRQLKLQACTVVLLISEENDDSSK